MDEDRFIEAAKGYYSALQTLVDNISINKDTLSPIGLMASQAIELALKAYLTAKGRKERELIAIGHDLSALLDEAQKEGLKTHFDQDFSVNVLSLNHNRPFLYRYPKNGVAAAITKPRVLVDHVGSIIEKVEKSISGA